MNRVAVAFVLSFTIVGCKTESGAAQAVDAASPGAVGLDGGDSRASGVMDGGPAETGGSAEANVKALVTAWSHALDAHDLSSLGPMYAPRVHFYTSDVSRAAVLAAKSRALGAASIYRQTIVGDITVEARPDGAYAASFTKRSGMAKLSDVMSRLVVKSSDGGAFQIIEETDAPSLAAADAKRLDACKALAAKVVAALPAVKKTMDDAQKEIDAKYKDRAIGGLGPIDGDDGFTVSIGVHQPERYEALVWYSVNQLGNLSVQILGEEQVVPPAQMSEVRAACNQSHPHATP